MAIDRWLSVERGVLPSQALRELIAGGVISASVPVEDRQVQPNSLDLRLGDVAYRVQCSFLPAATGMRARLENLVWYRFAVDEEGSVLEPGQVYIIPLMESVALPDSVSGKCNAKSTTGRLDIFARVVTEYGVAFDEIPAGYRGPLYLEVVPQSFPIVVRPGDALAQLRLQLGAPKLTDDEIRVLADNDPLVLAANRDRIHSADLIVREGVYLSVALNSEVSDIIGYRARRNTYPIDLRRLASYRITDFWDLIRREEKKRVILAPGEFYIFASRERVVVPPEVCADLAPYEPGTGEFRVHYAGFLDSGFGYGEGNASAVVLEIRNRDVPFLVEDGQPLFKVTYYRNAALPERLYGSGVASNYQAQTLKLAKQFAMSD